MDLENTQQTDTATTDEVKPETVSAQPGADEAKQGEQQPAARTYTQDDVDRLINIQKAKQPPKDEWQAFKAWKSEQDRQNESKLDDETRARIAEKDSENSRLKAENAALKLSVIPDAIEDVVTLAQRLVNDETDINAAISAVLKKYPNFGKQAATETSEKKPPAIVIPQDNKPMASGMNQFMNDIIRGRKG